MRQANIFSFSKIDPSVDCIIDDEDIMIFGSASLKRKEQFAVDWCQKSTSYGLRTMANFFLQKTSLFQRYLIQAHFFLEKLYLISFQEIAKRVIHLNLIFQMKNKIEKSLLLYFLFFLNV